MSLSDQIGAVVAAIGAELKLKADAARTVNGHALTADVTVTKADVGLGSVDNTSDAAKPISTATQAALDDKADTSALFSGDYGDLSGKPTLGTAAATSSTAYATAAQGATADSAVQPGDLATVATSGAYSDLSGTPTPFSGAYGDLTGKPSIPDSLDDLSGTLPYSSLTGAPTIPESYSDLTGKVPGADQTYGTAASTACQGNDSRLSNARTPLAHTHAASDVNSGTLAIARIPVGTSGSTVAAGNDSRITGAVQPGSSGSVVVGSLPGSGVTGVLYVVP